MNILKKSRFALGIVCCALIGIMANVNAGKSTSTIEEVTAPQDVRGLDQRIRLLEQRLYTIELNLNRFQQEALSQRRPYSQSNVPEQEIIQLRDAVQKLQLRIIEIECGLVKLDERTTRSGQDTRNSEGTKAVDPCRLNPQTPLSLSNRP